MAEAAYRIDTFDVPSGEETAFLALWRSEGVGRLYRALRADATFAFVAFVPAGPAADGSFVVVREEGDVDGSDGGATLIGRPSSLDEWSAARAFFGGRRGFIGARVLRATADGGGLVVVTRWSSPLMIHRALSDPECPRGAGGVVYRSV